MAWERWSGGRVWVGQDGTRTYYGEVAGKMVSTRKHTEEEAVAELMRMSLGAGAGPESPLSDRNLAAYLEDCRKRGLSGVAEKKRHLEEWRKKIGPRKPTLPILNEIGKGMTGARNKIASLKAYFTWLRQEGKVQRQFDPTLDLAKPEAPKRKKWGARLIPLESHKKVISVLESQRWKDCMTLLLATGMHVQELLRFCRHGEIDGNALIIQHKRGTPHRVPVKDKTLEVAKRLRAQGGFNLSNFYRDLKEAYGKAGVEYKPPGGYRHTTATLARKAGASPERVADFLGHKSAYMVKTIYAETVVPEQVPTFED